MKIVTLHPVYNLNKSFFSRDVAQIGFTMHKKTWLSSEIWCLHKKGEEDFEISWQQRVGSTRLKLLKKLRKDAKNIQYLNIYHIWHWSFIYSYIYKLRNHYGKIFLKLDLWIHNMNSIKYIFRVFIKPILEKVNVLWYEDERVWNWLMEKYPTYKTKIQRITNGVNPIDNLIWHFNKKNQIILCGRFWSAQKNNKLLLDVLLKRDISFLKGREILLMGSYTDEFNAQLDILFQFKPELKFIIKKIGYIHDPIEKYTYYINAKIFLHTANYEWDTNIQYDAMFWGCFMISTDVANMKQIYLDKYSIFYNIWDAEWLYQSLKDWINIVNWLTINDYTQIQDHLLVNYTRDKIVTSILYKLQ